jgi:hypothetical protein
LSMIPISVFPHKTPRNLIFQVRSCWSSCRILIREHWADILIPSATPLIPLIFITDMFLGVTLMALTHRFPISFLRVIFWKLSANWCITYQSVDLMNQCLLPHSIALNILFFARIWVAIPSICSWIYFLSFQKIIASMIVCLTNFQTESWTHWEIAIPAKVLLIQLRRLRMVWTRELISSHLRLSIILKNVAALTQWTLKVTILSLTSLWTGNTSISTLHAYSRLKKKRYKD